MKKECRNCIHYIAYYIKDGAQFRAIMQGHCTNRKPSGHCRKTNVICENYTERDFEKEKQEQKKSAAQSLALIARSIDELTQILRDE